MTLAISLFLVNLIENQMKYYIDIQYNTIVKSAPINCLQL